MRIIVILILYITTSLILHAQQQFYPIKKNKKWGLMDARGNIQIKPIYDAIGEFKQFGYAVMQLQGKVGLLSNKGLTIIPARFEDVKVLDTALIAVMDRGEWMVVNLEGKVVLNKGYQRVLVWDSQYLAFMKEKKWGVVDINGRNISAPLYDEINFEKGYFKTKKGKKVGLLTPKGEVVLAAKTDEVRIYSDSLFFFKNGHNWGAVSRTGKQVIAPKFDTFNKISKNFIRLLNNGKWFVYSIPYARLITNGQYDNYYAFSKKYIIIKNKRQLGLLDWLGNTVLATQYNEIQPYGKEQFRVNRKGKWGIVKQDDKEVIPFDYDYISPLRTKICVVKKGRQFGIVNYKGEEVIAPTYDEINLKNNKAKAYKNASLTILDFDERGQLKDDNQFQKHFTFKIKSKQKKLSPNDLGAMDEEDNLLLENFEWFYSPAVDRWGLRRLNGEIQIDPTFDYVRVERDLGFTLVGLEKAGKHNFERTTYRFEMVFGLVKNDVGLLVTEIDFWDIQMQDFRSGLPVARCVFSNGRHGLVNNIGKILRRDFAFIGQFNDGMARVSTRGKLSGSLKGSHSLGRLEQYLAQFLSMNYMSDYTAYDQEFQNDAHLICQDCEWGYMDTLGQITVSPQYTFAQDFINEVGMVECDNKWGLVNRKAEILIPCRYDGIDFLENTNNQIIKVFVKEHKYGLIDTLGQLAVQASYDEIGSFSEGRLAVKSKGLWGFVDANGLEVIPPRFKTVSDFSEGLAAVKVDRKWGFIDKQGNTEIPFEYNRVGNFKNGLAWIYTGGGYSYIRQTGELLMEGDFQKAFDFEKNVARVAVDGKYGLIDQTGDWQLKPRYSDIAEFNEYGLAIVRYGADRIRYGLINQEGLLITDNNYRKIGVFREGMAAVKYKNGYGFINMVGRMVIKDKYSKVSDFSEGRAAVQRNGLCGYIDKNGKEVVDLKYSKCLDFSDGKGVVYRGNKKAGLVDMHGKEIIKPSLNRLIEFSEDRGLMRDDQYRFYYITDQARVYDGYYQNASKFQHGVAVVKIDGKWGIINQKGIEVIPPKYDQIDNFQNGYAKVRIKGFNGLTNLRGELIVQPDYEYISYAGEGLFRVEQGDMIGYFDSSGVWVWGLKK